jgi:hypothetical protein
MWFLKEIMQNSLSSGYRARHASLYHFVSVALALFLILLSGVLGLGFAYEWLRFYWEPWMALGILASSTFASGSLLLIVVQQIRKRSQASLAQSIAAPLINANNVLMLHTPQIKDILRKSRWELLGLMLLLGFAYAQRGGKKPPLA